MSLDHYVTLGRSGLRVSPLCLGAMTFGEEFGFGSNVATSGKACPMAERNIFTAACSPFAQPLEQLWKS